MERITGKPKNCLPAGNSGSFINQMMRVMKITAVLLLVFCVQLHATGYGQKLTLLEKDVPVEKIFKEIKKQTGYKFLYTSQVLENAKNVTIEVKNGNLVQVLELCCKDQPFTYEIKEQTIIIKSRSSVTIFQMPQSPFSPVIKGKVVNENGEPVVASVAVKGTSKGTTSNQNGEFTLPDVDANAVLIISGVGIETTEIKLNGRTELFVAVKIVVKPLDETVVIAYGTTTRRLATGNVVTIKATDIEKQPVQNPLLALEGRVPGLEITQATGMNGGAVTARIQGINSIRTGALDPLIVIDGVPYPSVLSYSGMEGGTVIDGLPIAGAGGFLQGGSPLNYINPNDIESIDVLKDADATAIYGSRAGNGAILITTKKGKAGKTKVNVNLQQGWGKIGHKVPMMNTRQYLNMRYEAYKNNGINISTLTPGSSNYDLTLWDTTRYTDWQKTLIGGTAQYTDVSADISGGSPIMQYLIGGSYNRQTTVFPGSFDDKKGSLHFSINSISPNQKLKVQLNGSFVYDKNFLPGVDLTQQAILLAPDAPTLYNPDGTLNWAPNAGGVSTWTNPLSYVYPQDFSNNTKNLVSNLMLGYKILPGLEVKSSFGYNSLGSILYQAVRLESFAPETRATSDRYANFSTRNMNTWIIEPQLQYTGNISKGKIEVLLGGTLQRNNNDVLTQGASGFSSDLVMKSIAAAPSLFIVASSNTIYKYAALFGRLNYNWAGKYIINLAARKDGSSRFGDNNKFHSFGSIASAWIFSEEKWIKQHASFVSFGKIKASYGTTGNDQIADYSFLSLYFINNLQIPYQNTTSLVDGRITNPNLQWEETRKLQGGIDLGFLNDRILMNATYARNRSSNQLINYNLPTVTGFNNVIENFPATIQNTSWEFMLTTNPIKEKNINWTSIINLTIPRNKVVSFPNIELTPYGRKSSSVMIGQPLGVTKVLSYVSVDPATGLYQVADSLGNPVPVTSRPNFPRDYNNIIINTSTRFYGGFENAISYKGFQLDFLFQFVIRKGPRQLYYSNGNFRSPGQFSSDAANEPVTLVNHHWQKPGDNAEFALFTTKQISMYPPATNIGYTFDASYVRLKNVSLSWQFPASWIKKLHLQNALIYFRGQNLATITKFSGLDPETLSTVLLPPLRLWTLGGKLEF